MKPIDPSGIVPGVDLSAAVASPTRKLRPVTYDDIMLAPSIDGHKVCSMREAVFSMWTLPRCRVCENTGEVCATAEFTSLVRGSRCPCMPAAAMVGRLSRARIPWAYYYVSQSYLGQVGQGYVRDYQPKGTGLRFVGPTGRGKTHRMRCARPVRAWPLGALCTVVSLARRDAAGDGQGGRHAPTQTAH